MTIRVGHVGLRIFQRVAILGMLGGCFVGMRTMGLSLSLCARLLAWVLVVDLKMPVCRSGGRVLFSGLSLEMEVGFGCM